MEISVLIEECVEALLGVDWLQGIVEQVLVSERVGSRVELGLVIASQERVQGLNWRYRGWDEPTDVLAFSAMGETATDSPPFVVPPDGVQHLGEVIISYPQAVMQAVEQQHPVEREVAFLIVHGVLHLLGYGHDEPERERQMKAREKEILTRVEVE